jgi:hypothetical protein
MPDVNDKPDWDRAHRATVFIAAVSLLVGATGLIVAIITYAHENSLDARRLSIVVTGLVAGRCPVNDPLFVDVINTGFQSIGIRLVEFEEEDGELIIEHQAKIVQSTAQGQALRLKSLPVSPGDLTLTLAPGVSHEFTYSVENLVRHRARRVNVIDQDGKVTTMDLRSALRYGPETVGCPL